MPAWLDDSHHAFVQMTRLPMGAKCGKVTCCAFWVQVLNPGCAFSNQSFGVGSREARLPPSMGGKCVINAQQPLLDFTLSVCLTVSVKAQFNTFLLPIVYCTSAASSSSK